MKRAISALNPGERDYKIGDTLKVFLRARKTSFVKVEVVGFDSCPSRHPIFKVISGKRRGQRVSCSDVIFI